MSAAIENSTAAHPFPDSYGHQTINVVLILVTNFTKIASKEVKMKISYLIALLLIFPVSTNAEELSAPNFNSEPFGLSKLHQKFENTDFSNITASERSSGTNIYKNTIPSVVKVLTNEGHGTGVVISDIGNGIILTNFHVVEDYETVGVIFSTDSDTDKLSIGAVIKVDEIRDLALVSLNTDRPDLVPLMISEDPGQIGEDVHAIGHPLGEDWTYTRGYISQLRQNYSWQTGANRHHAADIVQTQTPINPGNSGGPLINEAGKLIGINSFVNDSAQGLNYAVSVTSIYDFLESDGNTLQRTMPENSDLFGNLIRSLDENKNGQPDVYLFDKSYNDTLDRIVFDDTENLSADRIYFDDDENGQVEVKLEFIQYEGREIAVYEFDEDQDGVFELIAVDYDLDGEIDDIGPNN